MVFEWDETKRQANLAKHLIDFADAIRIFQRPVFEKLQRRHGEDRVLAFGLLEDVEIVVIYDVRGKYRRMLLPMHPSLKHALLEWKSQSLYNQPEHFTF